MTPIGYIVLTWNEPGGWQPDWDGKLHTSLADGLAELTEAQGQLANEGDALFAILVACHAVPASDANITPHSHEGRACQAVAGCWRDADAAGATQ